MPAFVGTFIIILANILTFAIIIRSILSWFPGAQNNPLVAIVYQLTEPILAPLRAIVPRFGMIDLTPMIVVLLLQFVVIPLVAAFV